VVERIDGAECELDVALGIDVVENFQRDVGEILHVYIFVDHDDDLGEHGLAKRPDGVHHFASLTGIGLADGDDHQVVEDAFDGKIDVDQFRYGETHQRQKDALDGFAHVGVFHGRLADDGGGVDGIFAVRDAGDMEDRVEIGERVEAGVVAEGAFGAEFVEVDVALEDDFAGGGNFEVDGLALDEFDGGGAEESGDQVFFDVGRSGDDGGKVTAGSVPIATATSMRPEG
jgi:hypothetical protein